MQRSRPRENRHQTAQAGAGVHSLHACRTDAPRLPPRGNVPARTPSAWQCQRATAFEWPHRAVNRAGSGIFPVLPPAFPRLRAVPATMPAQGRGPQSQHDFGKWSEDQAGRL